jgi:predicted amidohydrolase YtcJ
MGFRVQEDTTRRRKWVDLMTATLFTNCRFWTLDAEAPEPHALLARGGRIEALAHHGEVQLSDVEVIDLGGRTAIPGPVDAHCHLVSYGMMRHREADLRGARSLAEIGQRLRSHAEAQGIGPGDGRWLLGRGFDQDLMAEARWPTRHDLDAIAPEVPLRITRICGHAVVANTTALRAAGLDPAVRHGDFPEGVLTETAIAPVYAAVPPPTADEWRAAALTACKEAARMGFVGVHSLMAHQHEVRALVDLRREGSLPVRVQMHLPYAMLEQAAGTGLRTGYGDDYLSLGAIKLFSDGSLGARTAALRAPYTDDPSTTGELIFEPEELARRVRAVREAGFQVCIHAIGDHAMDVTLNAIEAAGAAEPWPFPPRIEHASMVDAAILARMKALGVGAAVQPQFARSDYWAPERLGEDRAQGCYAFRTLWEAGVPLAGSTDCPVETLDAMAAIGQMVHRPDWSPDEGLPLDAALRVFSEGSYALQGRVGGRLAPGEWADFLVLEHDPRSVQPEEIEKIPVAMTVVGGRVVAVPDS